MIKINVMRTFLNRLIDRGWKKVSLRGYTNIDILALRRGNKNIVCVENIAVDPSVDLIPQIEEIFRTLIEIIKRCDAKEIFLPCGGDVLIPDFFRDFCSENAIRIYIVSNESFCECLNYN